MAIDYTKELRDFIALGDGKEVLRLAMDAKNKGNTETALDLFHLAAGMGESDALFEIASIYVEGNGIPKDLELGLSYYRMAKEKGNARAEKALSDLL